jgi:hypothetical protein
MSTFNEANTIQSMLFDAPGADGYRFFRVGVSLAE